MGIGKKISRAHSFVRFWLGQRIHGVPVSAAPHFDPDTQAFFLQRIADAHFYLEFGSGGSTMVAARHGVRTIAVESDGYYAKQVRHALGSDTSATVVHVPIGLTQEWGNPLFRRPTPSRLHRWRQYTELVFQSMAGEAEFPDFVLVDGRFRRACALETARQALKRGVKTTILLDDYAERPHYHSVERLLGPPTRIGRAALFEVEGSHQHQPILPDDVRKAQCDPR